MHLTMSEQVAMEIDQGSWHHGYINHFLTPLIQAKLELQMIQTLASPIL